MRDIAGAYKFCGIDIANRFLNVIYTEFFSVVMFL